MFSPDAKGLAGLVSAGETALPCRAGVEEMVRFSELLSAGEIVRVAFSQLLPAETLETCF